MKELYTVKEASELTGISKPAVRAYAGIYSRFLSTEATPAQGQERKFTADDLRVLAFARGLTKDGVNHDQVIERLQSGALDAFDWQPPEEPESPPAPQESPESASTALVPVERLVTAQMLLSEATRREREAVAKAESLEAEVRRLERELGEASGRLAARYRAPAWFKRIFGGAPD